MTSNIVLIHVALKQIGLLDESDRRALYARITGLAHLTQMDEAQRLAVIAELRRLGFKPALSRRHVARRPSGRYATKLQALWIAAYNLALVRDRSDSALEAFVRRQTGLERERFLHRPQDAARVIEALKAWIARETGVDWSPRLTDGERITTAQCRLLGLSPDAVGLTVPPQSPRDWQGVMNRLGQRLRERREE